MSESTDPSCLGRRQLEAEDLKIGRVSIRCIAHPEWGAWGIKRKVTYDGATWWVLTKGRVLFESELRFWELTNVGGRPVR